MSLLKKQGNKALFSNKAEQPGYPMLTQPRSCSEPARTRAQPWAGLDIPIKDCDTEHHLNVIQRSDFLSSSHRTGLNT